MLDSYIKYKNRFVTIIQEILEQFLQTSSPLQCHLIISQVGTRKHM